MLTSLISNQVNCRITLEYSNVVIYEFIDLIHSPVGASSSSPPLFISEKKLSEPPSLDGRLILFLADVARKIRGDGQCVDFCGSVFILQHQT